MYRFIDVLICRFMDVQHKRILKVCYPSDSEVAISTNSVFDKTPGFRNREKTSPVVPWSCWVQLPIEKNNPFLDSLCITHTHNHTQMHTYIQIYNYMHIHMHKLYVCIYVNILYILYYIIFCTYKHRNHTSSSDTTLFLPSQKLKCQWTTPSKSLFGVTLTQITPTNTEITLPPPIQPYFCHHKSSNVSEQPHPSPSSESPSPKSPDPFENTEALYIWWHFGHHPTLRCCAVKDAKGQGLQAAHRDDVPLQFTALGKNRDYINP